MQIFLDKLIEIDFGNEDCYNKDFDKKDINKDDNNNTKDWEELNIEKKLDNNTTKINIISMFKLYMIIKI